MRNPKIFAASILAVATFGFISMTHADPLVRSGFGLTVCKDFNTKIKPGAGFDHMPNALFFYWVQGYLSAANIHLLNEYNDYIDIGLIEEPEITKMIFDYCKANPDKRPVNGLDAFIVKRKKIEIKESDAFDPWDH